LANGTRQESLKDLWRQLYHKKVWIRKILKDSRFAEAVRSEQPETLEGYT